VASSHLRLHDPDSSFGYNKQTAALYSSENDFNNTHTHTHTRLTARFSGTTRVSRYQKGKTNLDFSEARDSEWQWHQLDHMQVCTSLQTDTPPLSFLQVGCPSCHPTNSVKALILTKLQYKLIQRSKSKPANSSAVAEKQSNVLFRHVSFMWHF